MNTNERGMVMVEVTQADRDAVVEAEVAAMAEVLCTERCAQAGEPPCSSVEVCGHCDECLGMAMAVLAHLEARGEP